MPDLAPLTRAADEFGVSQATIYRYLSRGQLTRHKRGMDRKTYVDLDELRHLLEFRRVDGGLGLDRPEVERHMGAEGISASRARS